jgi:hypothetical protein
MGMPLKRYGYGKKITVTLQLTKINHGYEREDGKNQANYFQRSSKTYKRHQ